MSRSEFLVEGMPVVAQKLSGKNTNIFRDTGSSTVIVRKDLVRQDELTGETNPAARPRFLSERCSCDRGNTNPGKNKGKTNTFSK